jgi:spore maturation protein CgeB
MLLTDEGRNLSDLFEPGREIVTYRDSDDLADRIAYYLEHEEERAAIARAGQARTLAEHTYEHRMRELVEILGRYLA